MRPPPFSEDFTFSLELEFRLKDQKFNIPRCGHLPAQRKVISDFLKSTLEIPPHWILEEPSAERENPEEVYELKTASSGQAYHTNTALQWQELTEHLERIQSRLQGGFWSLHTHIGRCSKTTQENQLRVYKKRFGSLIKIYEAMWRVLGGLRYSAPRKGRILTTYGIDFLYTGGFQDILSTQEQESFDAVHAHSAMINLSTKFPTIEIKILSNLLNQGKLDCDALPQHLWWGFALLECVTEDERAIPLATMGIPSIAGSKPSWKQINRFLDLMFPHDVLGKELALQHFLRADSQPGGSPAQMACRTLEGAFVFSQLGLSTIYELHEQADGYDPYVEEKVLSSRALLQTVQEELNQAAMPWELEELFSNPLLIAQLRTAVRYEESS